MCGGGSAPKPPPPKVQPPVQPPVIAQAAPEVAIGNKSESETKRRKIGRSQLRSTPSGGKSAPSSGLGS